MSVEYIFSIAGVFTVAHIATPQKMAPKSVSNLSSSFVARGTWGEVQGTARDVGDLMQSRIHPSPDAAANTHLGPGAGMALGTPVMCGNQDGTFI